MAMWGRSSILSLFRNPVALAVLILAYIASTFVHQMLHAAGWVLFGKIPWSCISLDLKHSTLLPSCKWSIPICVYQSALLLPGIILGILPALIGLTAGVSWLSLIGAINSGAALPDFLILWVLRQVPVGARIQYRAKHASYHVSYELDPRISEE